MTANPLLRMTGDPEYPVPLAELKTRLVLYTAGPPGPVTAGRVYALYMAQFGDAITHYRSTGPGELEREWTPSARTRFEREELPALRQKADWGYLFAVDQPTDARGFLFHGFRPVSEPGRAGVFRFDFEWNFDPAELRSFTALVLEAVGCVCGTAGYVINPDEEEYAAPAYNQMFAWAMRYWGAQAQDLDTDTASALGGFPCVGWLTVIGPALRAKDPEAVELAKAVAHASFEVGGHVVIQAEERPRLIDRNQREPLGNYPAVAQALLPLQVKEHNPFGGDMWDEDNTMRYLRRFTHPDEV